jgi:hypothetical protein
MLKEVDDYWGAEAAVRSGMWAALGYAAWVTISVIITAVRTDIGLAFQLMDNLERILFVGLIAGRLGLALLAAWRFKLGKGAITGGLTAVVLVGVVVLEVSNGLFQGILWYALLIAIELALINGVRGALALRGMHDPEDVVETFE